MVKKSKSITAEEFDKKVDEGEDVSDYLDLASAVKKVNVDFPLWMVEVLDAEAKKLQIPRHAVIKNWINEKIENRIAFNAQIERRKSLG